MGTHVVFSWGNVSLASFITTCTYHQNCHFFKIDHYFSTNWVCSYAISTWEILSSVTQLCPTLCNPMDCSTPGFPVHHQLLELPQTHVHYDSDAIQPSHPLSSPSPPAFNISQQPPAFNISKESVLCIRWQNYWSFRFSITPSNSGLISIRIDWLDLFAVRGTFKSLLQHHSSKASFFSAQLSL